MLFSSVSFLFYFLPAVLLLYFLVPKELKNATLVASSLFFYAWGEPRNLFIMIAATTIGFFFGILIERYHGRKQSKVFLFASIAIDLLILGFFKYFNFFADSFCYLTGKTNNVIKIALPIGISFYIFQLISYTVDVYRQNTAAQKNIISLATYITMFPQLIAGPIVRYSEISEQLNNRQTTLTEISSGIFRFAVGLAKKVIIANQLGELSLAFENSTDRSIFFYWLYAISFALQIYFDFSGYSDMAIGLGKLFGFKFPENFDYPFASRSITEFWRRWHISLGQWFRDYLYIPLGGNRTTKIRWLFNIFAVWSLTGLWHGANWNFVLWGIYFAVLLVIEKLLLSKLLKKSVVLSRIYLVFFVTVSFVIFSSTDLSTIVASLKSMFGFENIPLVSFDFIYYLKSYSILLIVAVLGSLPIFKNVVLRLKHNSTAKKLLNIAEPFYIIFLLVLSTAYIIDGSFNPFLYFRF